MLRAASNSGFSLLEVLVVLAIGATVFVVLAATLISPNRGTRWTADISRFLADAQVTALRSGAPLAVVLDADQARAGGRVLVWPPPVATYVTEGEAHPSAVLVLDSHGVAILGPTTIARDGQTWTVDDLLLAARR